MTKSSHTTIPDLNKFWGKKCHKFIFASSQHETYTYINNTYTSIDINVTSGVRNSAEKVMKSLDYAYKYHPDYDWYLKVEDKMYVVMENLRYFLSEENPDSKVYFGHAMKSKVSFIGNFSRYLLYIKEEIKLL